MATGSYLTPNYSRSQIEMFTSFLGTSVDLSSSLLDMFDTIVAKNTQEDEAVERTPSHPASRLGSAPPPCDPGGKENEPKRLPPLSVPFSGHRPNRSYSKRSYSESAFQEKKRPLSSSSVSSSSSSSSSSLPRNCLDVKKSYLASIESLDDDDDDDDSSNNRAGPNRDGPLSGSTGAATTGPTGGKPRWCDPNLSHTDRVVLEIVDTEKTYVRDLNEIIEAAIPCDSNLIAKKCKSPSPYIKFIIVPYIKFSILFEIDNLVALHFKYDQARRRFVEWAQNEIAVVPDFHKRILFSDEAHVWLNGYVNKQNCRIWSEANPQVYVETLLHPEKLTVWCTLWAGGILLQKR
ncbi:pleckstrin y domain-containing family G member 1 [Trichonephila clavipes]|nr:pleckstrin y domain-containing family G member 1 [Trichonephila clavipes]